MHPDDIDSILSRRVEPPQPDKGLADKIIHAAISHPKNLPSKSWKNIMMGMFKPTSPRIGLAFCAVTFILFAGIIQFNSIPFGESNQTAGVLSEIVDEDWAMVLDVYTYDMWL